MDTSALKQGDLIRCNVRDQKFEAIYEGLTPRTEDGRALVPRHRVSPLSARVSYRTVTARQIECKLERQERLGVGA